LSAEEGPVSIETAYKALETSMEHCSALQSEMNKVPVGERGHLMRAFELLDLLEHDLLETAKELKRAVREKLDRDISGQVALN
jgi:hypothetical protein